MDTILSGHGSEVVGETKKLLQQTLDGYCVGLIVNEINFQNLLPPPEVKEAFDDANNAGNNQQQFINDAQAYAAKVVPLARGEAARIRAEAEGYKAAHIAAATGDAQRFSLIDAQYSAAPEVTRKRLYLETMQDVLARNQKVIDQSNGKNLLYLPLDKIKAGLLQRRCRCGGNGGARRTTAEAANETSDAHHRAVPRRAGRPTPPSSCAKAKARCCCSSAASKATDATAAPTTSPACISRLPLIQQVVRFDRRMLNLEAQPERYFTSEKKAGQRRLLRQVADRKSGAPITVRSAPTSCRRWPTAARRRSSRIRCASSSIRMR